MISRFAAAIAAAMFMATSANAGEIVDAAAKAENALAEGRHVDALADIDAARGKVWDAVPLTIAKALFVGSRPSGYGAYDERGSNSFKLGEEIMVYAEPVGFGYRADGSYYQIDLVVDFEVRTSTGQVLGGQQNFGVLKARSRYMNKEFHAFLSYSFTGLQVGKYVLVTTLNDAVTGQKASFELPFEAVE
ncbi:MAG: hypothetical protein KDJ16_02105 [Hyphomicrobiales bacterium]|nr:hypothetical protein [Hyphomicrobiales bacterium]